MSSFPEHEENIKDLEAMGFDVSDNLEEDGSVSLESWNYDELVYTLSGVIAQLHRQNFKVKENGNETCH